MSSSMYSYVYTGKKYGYVATCDIQKGTVLLQEKPAICIEKKYSEEARRRIKTKFKEKYLQNIADRLLDYKYVIQVFENLSEKDQDTILEMSYFYKSCSEEIEVLTTFFELLDGLPKMKEILKVCCIFQTHQYKKCLYVNASKFNHSCHPKTEMFNIEDKYWKR